MNHNTPRKPYDQERDSPARRVAKKVGKIAAIGLTSSAAVLGASGLLGHAIDNSPTTKLQRSYEERDHSSEKAKAAELSVLNELQQQENTTPVSQQELEHFKQHFPDDPSTHVG